MTQVESVGRSIPNVRGDVEAPIAHSKITAVNMVRADATAGRDQAFPYLTDYAIQAQGSNFGNLSGATFTTEAFKQALDSAISKLS
ncbi:MAG: FMN-binding protein [Microbacteriaceae bacterium]|nr:FMN-binding protein [Microbacteriaceae bacterium]